MNAITVKMLMDHPICTSVACVIKAPAPIGVVAAMAPSPPKNRRRVPRVSIASRNRFLTRLKLGRVNGNKIYSLENHDRLRVSSLVESQIDELRRDSQIVAVVESLLELLESEPFGNEAILLNGFAERDPRVQ